MVQVVAVELVIIILYLQLLKLFRFLAIPYLIEI